VIAAIVLAAGASKRFGRQKLIERYMLKPIVRRAVDAAMASGVDETIVVTGGDDRVRRAVERTGARCVTNAAWESGMASTIAAGITALAPGTQAALIVLGDQPTVPAKGYRAVLDAYGEHGTAIVVPVYWPKVRGHPVLFDASVFPELLALSGDRGAREVIQRDPARVREVRVLRAAPPDVDTPEDVNSILNLLHLIQ
jgi:molybdenum cofactor cytidylyltransferase